MTNEEELKFVVTSIKRIRKAKKMSQLDVSVKANISQSFLANVENGKKEPSAMTLIRIARAIECSPRDFFPESEFDVSQIERKNVKNEIIQLLERL
ncbi:MAG: helix-turn-helix domain-containing protein [Treponema sp.]|nr:helix-turn-helix domain-containing protein [Treponema sp.]